MTKSKRPTQQPKTPSKAPTKPAEKSSSTSTAKPVTAAKPAAAAKPATAAPAAAVKPAAAAAKPASPSGVTKTTVPIGGKSPVAVAKKAAPAQKAAPNKGMETVKPKSLDVNEPEDNDLRQGDLVKAVAERASVRNNLARDIVVATLEELGLAVRSNREMKLPGLGRVKYQRVKQNVNSIVTIAKIRQDKDD